MAAGLRVRRAGGATDVGRHRKHNEDHFLIREDHGLYLVADGMGGHQAGDVASALATLSVCNFYDATQNGESWSDAYKAPSDAALSPSACRLAAALRKANADVYAISSSHRKHRGMGSTIVAVYVPREGDEVHVGHVGDSRCYRIRGGDIEQITRDHSLLNEALAMDPKLTAEELARVPTNIITRALGMEPSVEAEVSSLRPEPDDVLLLCSDGLSSMVTNAQIREAISLMSDARETCDLLIDLANEAGGMDNVTALIVQF
ncbi:MAG: serine/threonine-protein phosphatase [Myxococcales bacterium]|nr:serine/threonine-protein phosphatase [Myxococcales bacterium]